ncbi:MAG: sugar transporter [Desulfobacter postgatei]|uniref:Sugar transporter n=1 Tax=Desulfobacter postgatei TaxID=2293 RepID=A0A2G6MS69_9BACT|nr:MAG: sugar transporter [Desulfobacter postgatei]
MTIFEKKIAAGLICLSLLMAAVPCTGGEAESQEDVNAAIAQATYKIGAGDVLEISVWKNPDLTRQVVVLPDNTIRFPLIGEIKTGGHSLAWLEKILETRLEKFISDPELSVSLTRVNSLIIYVIGKVKGPGRFQMAENVDVLQALAMAGGLNAFAKDDEIKIFRKQGQMTQIFEFDYDAVSQGEELDQNITLERGDVIVVR